MSEHHDQGEASLVGNAESNTETSLDGDSMEQMAKYGIICSQVNMFFYEGYRYTSLADAIAEAKRHPPAS